MLATACLILALFAAMVYTVLMQFGARRGMGRARAPGRGAPVGPGLFNRNVRWKTGEVQITDVDTETQLQGLGTGAAATVRVPDGYGHLWGMIPGYSSDSAALGSGGAIAILEGDGIVHGPQHIPLGGSGGELITGGSTHNPGKQLKNLGIAVNDGEQITVQTLMVGEDVGTCSVTISFGFLPGNPPVYYKWKALEVQIVAVDTATQLQGLGTAVAADLEIPGYAIFCDRIIGWVGSDGAALGSGNVVIRMTDDGVEDTVEVCIGGAGGENITGAGSHFQVVDFDQMGIEIKSGDAAQVDGYMVGEDMGTVSLCVAWGFVINPNK